MGRLVSIDGKVVRAEEAQVSIYDRGFLYGDSIFETLRTYGGALFALEEHLDRLALSAKKVEIELPVPLATLGEETRRVVREAGNGESYVRMILTRGSGPMGLVPVAELSPLRVVMVDELSMPPASDYHDGISTVLVETVRASDAADHAKVGNYLASLLALREARSRGAKEALIVNRSGRVVEGTTSNLFLVRAGALITPPTSEGILEGITRRRVLEAAKRLGVPTMESPIEKDDLMTADEAFITSSIREVMPVVKVDDTTIGSGSPGLLMRKIHAEFRRHVGAESAETLWTL